MAYGLTTVSVGDSAQAAHHNGNGDSISYLQGLEDVDHDFNTSSGTGYHNLSIADAQHIEVVSGTIWTCGWWKATDNSWWLLVNTASADAFARGDAEFFLQTSGGLTSVPSS
jgi:hypothetical protein